MTPEGNERALVVGGGYAGLVTARVLADRFDEVVVLEQDDVTAAPVHRRGTPQSRHPHALLARGADLLEHLFPGLRAELRDAGAPVSDFGQFPMLYPAGWSPRVRTDLALQTFSRPLLESALRRRVLAHPRVRLLDRTRVARVVFDDARGHVVGVRTEGGSLRPARLVVVATGRNSRLPAGLATGGLPVPDVLRVDGRLSYTSRVYRRDTASPPNWQASLQATFAPTARRGGTVVALEDDRWLVCLFGADGQSAPTDPAGFAAYADSLANPHIKDIVTRAEPLGSIYRYGGLGGQWRRYDRIRPWPAGLAVLGDALCVLNPLYGHGMTVAVQQAVLLARTLDAHAPADACGHFQRRSARTLLLPWYLSTSLDLGWRPENAPVAALLARRYLARLLRRIPDDPALYRRFLAVQHLTASPLTLLAPSSRTGRDGEPS
ncbi:FAD-dependent oxidoreductase [Streptomyces flavofungini]|uniref:FAD-dependent oxidoreductase n=1 Tax=Streptomyces flavofungini TaxID=68200 RepID=UPI0025B160C9|nr:FAD-dependent monooxygenase [Streptomyces flavofungini]WJV50619.1 monooxygenase [Streptomyces flavofungini]